MKQVIIDIFTPNKHANGKTRNIILWAWIFLVAIFWSTTNSKYIPKPWDILAALQDLIANQGFLRELMTSTTLCLKAMLYAIIISAVVAYLSVISAFKPAMHFVAKSRFLSAIGLVVLLAQMIENASDQKMDLLVFSITVFLTTSFLGVIASVTKDDLDYARTLKFKPWKVMYEVIILGKAADMWNAVKDNFAMAWLSLSMVEGICRSEGGIGVLLMDNSKHFRLDSVYAIQILILFTGIFFDWLLGYLKGLFFPYSVIKLER